MNVGQVYEMMEGAGGLPGVEELLGRPLSDYSHDCHRGSLAVLRTGIFGTPGQDARVARGRCAGIVSQHSWIVVGGGPYDRKAVIADPTRWSYFSGGPCVTATRNAMMEYQPHGAGSIWRYGRPDNCDPSQAVELAWRKSPSGAAQVFLDVLGPLDEKGWVRLAHYPVEGWPAGEIIGAIADTFGEVQVPVDILGMVTDRNPGGLYW